MEFSKDLGMHQAPLCITVKQEPPSVDKSDGGTLPVQVKAEEGVRDLLAPSPRMKSEHDQGVCVQYASKHDRAKEPRTLKPRDLKCAPYTEEPLADDSLASQPPLLVPAATQRRNQHHGRQRRRPEEGGGTLQLPPPPPPPLPPPPLPPAPWQPNNGTIVDIAIAVAIAAIAVAVAVAFTPDRPAGPRRGAAREPPPPPWVPRRVRFRRR